MARKPEVKGYMLSPENLKQADSSPPMSIRKKRKIA